MSKKHRTREDETEFTLYRCPNKAAHCRWFKAVERQGGYQPEHYYTCPLCGHSLNSKIVSLGVNESVKFTV